MAKRDRDAAASVLVVYRLVASPVLRDEHRSAKILGALARMELGPVSCAWFSRRTGLAPDAARALLEDICRQRCAQRIEVAWMDSAPAGEEPSRSSWFDLLELEGGETHRSGRLQRVFQFFRRTLG